MVNKIIESIDSLTEALNHPKSFLFECFSSVLGVVVSVFSVVVFEIIKEKFFIPRTEFKKLRRRVHGILTNNAQYYANPLGRTTQISSEAKEKYNTASAEMRLLACEVQAFASDVNGKKCCGIGVADIEEAGRKMIGLSNNFSDTSDWGKGEKNEQLAYEIMRLLGIMKKCCDQKKESKALQRKPFDDSIKSK